MKKIYTLTLLISFFSLSIFGQITITSDDMADIYNLGNSTIIHQDLTIDTYDIGSPGGNNDWDFTSLSSDTPISFEVIEIDDSPFVNEFPDADICTYSTWEFIITFERWGYHSINGGLKDFGSGEMESFRDEPSITTNTPFKLQYDLPLSYETQWSYSYTEVIEVGGEIISTINVSVDAEVDAYGTMTLPGNSSYEALRIREERDFDGIPSVNYIFLSQDGARVILEAEDSNPPTSGDMEVEGTWYNDGLSTVGVSEYSLKEENIKSVKNYPNPFMDKTTIEYELINDSHVEIKIFDLLGREVASLFNQQQRAGNHTVVFNVSGLDKGIYVAQVQADDYTRSVKMRIGN